MKSIKDIVIEKLEASDSPIALDELLKGCDYTEYNFGTSIEMKSAIMTDLMIDGKFISIDDKWDLKERYTMKEIIKNQRLEMVGLIQDDLEVNDEDEIIEDVVLEEDDGDVETIDNFLDADLLGEEDED